MIPYVSLHDSVCLAPLFRMSPSMIPYVSLHCIVCLAPLYRMSRSFVSYVSLHDSVCLAPLFRMSRFIVSYVSLHCFVSVPLFGVDTPFRLALAWGVRSNISCYLVVYLVQLCRVLRLTVAYAHQQLPLVALPLTGPKPSLAGRGQGCSLNHCSNSLLIAIATGLLGGVW